MLFCARSPYKIHPIGTDLMKRVTFMPGPRWRLAVVLIAGALALPLGSVQAQWRGGAFHGGGWHGGGWHGGGWHGGGWAGGWRGGWGGWHGGWGWRGPGWGWGGVALGVGVSPYY